MNQEITVNLKRKRNNRFSIESIIFEKEKNSNLNPIIIDSSEELNPSNFKSNQILTPKNSKQIKNKTKKLQNKLNESNLEINHRLDHDERQTTIKKVKIQTKHLEFTDLASTDSLEQFFHIQSGDSKGSLEISNSQYSSENSNSKKLTSFIFSFQESQNYQNNYVLEEKSIPKLDSNNEDNSEERFPDRNQVSIRNDLEENNNSEQEFKDSNKVFSSSNLEENNSDNSNKNFSEDSRNLSNEHSIDNNSREYSTNSKKSLKNIKNLENEINSLKETIDNLTDQIKDLEMRVLTKPITI